MEKNCAFTVCRGSIMVTTSDFQSGRLGSRNWKRKSSLNTFLTVEVPTNRHCDLLEFLLNTKNDIHDIIAEEVGVRGALKFYLTVRPQLSRTDPDGNEKISTPYLCSTPSIVLQSSDIHEEIDKASDRIKHLLDIHEGRGIWVQSRLYFGMSTQYSYIRRDWRIIESAVAKIYPE